MAQGVPLRKQQPARKKGRVSVWGGPHFVGSRGSAGNDWPCRAADRGQEKGESPRGRIREGANKTQGGRLRKARLNGSMAGSTVSMRRHCQKSILCARLWSSRSSGSLCGTACVTKSSRSLSDAHSRQAQRTSSTDWAGVLMEATGTRTPPLPNSVRWFVSLSRQ